MFLLYFRKPGDDTFDWNEAKHVTRREALQDLAETDAETAVEGAQAMLVDTRTNPNGSETFTFSDGAWCHEKGEMLAPLLEKAVRTEAEDKAAATAKLLAEWPLFRLVHDSLGHFRPRFVDCVVMAHWSSPQETEQWAVKGGLRGIDHLFGPLVPEPDEAG